MLLHTTTRSVHSSLIVALRNLYLWLKLRIKITNALPVSNQSNLTHVLRDSLSRTSNQPNDLNSFVYVYKGTCQGAIPSPTIFNNVVLDAQSKCISSSIGVATNVTLVCYVDGTLVLTCHYSVSKKTSVYSGVNILNWSWKSEILLFNWGNSGPPHRHSNWDIL